MTPLIKRHGPLFEQIYEILWERIISGEISTGERLQDIELAKRFSVSRTPAREAMRKLEQDGILVPAGAGYAVRGTTSDDLSKLYACRAALESLAARSAAGRLPKSIIRTLRASVALAQTYIERGAFSDVAEEHTEFHEAIVHASGNEHLVKLLASLRRQILFHRSSLRARAEQEGHTRIYADHLRRSQSFHLDLLDALESGDGDRAADLMHQHLSETALDMHEVILSVQDCADPSSSEVASTDKPSKATT